MKIVLLGYGKMGKTIEKLALEDGHEVIGKINENNLEDLTLESLGNADVAIEFSRPEAAFGNIKKCLEAGIPVVSGTTGWLEHMEEARAICRERQGAFLYASNFSIGMNVFFALNRYLAQLMDLQEQYDVSLEEIHHKEKLDAPSGTAVKLAEDIIRNIGRKNKWVKGKSAGNRAIPISSKRKGQAAGIHLVNYASAIDSISIRHEAHSREGFAEGALLAASWLPGKTGCFEMKDILGF